MRKNLLRLILFCALLLFVFSAQADVARDITRDCAFRLTYPKSSAANICDRSNETMYESDQLLEPRLYITVPSDTPVASVYLEYGRKKLPFDVQVKQDGVWQTVAACAGNYAQEYISFPPVTGEIRLQFITGKYAEKVGISEIYCFTEGEIDESIVHLWQPAPKKADLMIVMAHPDDEVLWLGGCIPYYAGERQMNVAVITLTCSHPFREIELLNCLWHCGVRTYPMVGAFQDQNTTSVDHTYEVWNRTKINSYLIDALRTLRPEVVVTHGFDGEYGHFHHVTAAYSMQRTVKMAAEENKYSALPLWQVKKLYHHGGNENLTVMDWDQPLKAFGGKTGYEMACEGFEKHVSQTRTWYSVARRGERWDSYVYSLTYSAVGADSALGDLFENIPAECISTYGGH